MVPVGIPEVALKSHLQTLGLCMLAGSDERTGDIDKEKNGSIQRNT